MFPFRSKSHDSSEQTPLLVDIHARTEPLLQQLALEQRCKQHFLTSVACLSFVCSLASLVMMLYYGSKRNDYNENVPSSSSFWQSSSNNNTTRYSHWSMWTSALTSCLMVSPLLALLQPKLVQLEVWKQGVAVYANEVNHLQRDNKILAKQVQQRQDALTPLSAVEEAVEILQSLDGNESMATLEQRLSNMERYWRVYNEGNDDAVSSDKDKDDDNHSCYHKATTELMQTLIQVLVSAANTTATRGGVTRSNRGYDDDDDDVYCLLLSDAELDQLVASLSSIRNVCVNGDALKRLVVQHGRGVASVMELIKQVLLYNEHDPPHEHAFFYFVTEKEEQQRHVNVARRK
ncbi:hypothetical protein MPSEU_000590300 [Mayamaea pseudoterrestris]|nr:hypothetical protein MPSEU_000590300 [Mayamaea pseudoterrestris]